jgi:hypothetical protein
MLPESGGSLKGTLEPRSTGRVVKTWRFSWRCRPSPRRAPAENAPTPDRDEHGRGVRFRVGSLRGAHRSTSTGRGWKILGISSSQPAESPKGARLERAGGLPPRALAPAGWKRSSLFGLDLMSTAGGYSFRGFPEGVPGAGKARATCEKPGGFPKGAARVPEGRPPTCAAGAPGAWPWPWPGLENPGDFLGVLT